MDLKKIVKDIQDLTEVPKEKCPFCEERVMIIDWNSNQASCLKARHLGKWHWSEGCNLREK